MTIVMTGGTSGFGAVALKRLKEGSEARLLCGSRNAAEIDGAEAIPLDLASLARVRAFASEVLKRIGEGEIDALVFNAGVSLGGGQVTEDGYETTFAVNHLAHYLLLRLLMPKLARGARIVLTTSGTYDPAEKTIIPVPLHADARLLAHPETDPRRDQDPRTAGGRAYSSSKLCVVLTARALASSPEAANMDWWVAAYDPGPTPGTKLVRSAPAPARLLWRLLALPLFRALIPSMNGVAEAGGALADLALGRAALPEGKIYVALRKGRLTYPELSELAARDELADSLWRDSAELAGLAEK